MMTRRTVLWVAAALAPAACAAENRTMHVTLRRRVERNAETWEAVERREEWNPADSALILCDVWDRHWCRGASERVDELAPVIDRFTRTARERGVLIIHAPSSCMPFYADHPARRRALNAPRAADLPPEIGLWCRSIPAEEHGAYPIDQNDGGCDDLPVCPQGSPWKRQHAAIEIRDEDAISDSGEEIWNLMDRRGIRNVMLAGVHTNMCVLGRPFGLRNLTRYGKNVVLVRDLTDTMYNSRARPFVSHFRGTELIVEHIEKYVCPTVLSTALLGGRPFRFRGDRRPPDGR
jgi:nicotinamidase-related amidase